MTKKHSTRALLLTLVLLLAWPANARAQEIHIAHSGVLIGPADRPALDDLKIHISTDTSSWTGDLEPEPSVHEKNAFGDCTVWRYRVKVTSPAPEVHLELREYPQQHIVVADALYNGPALAPEDGLAISFGLPHFDRGLAIARIKLYWTAPTFVSNYRTLSPHNQMLLWRQNDGDTFHLIAPWPATA